MPRWNSNNNHDENCEAQSDALSKVWAQPMQRAAAQTSLHAPTPIHPCAERNGRPVRARTADLHRVNCVVRKLNPFARFAFPVLTISRMPPNDRVLVTNW